MKSFPRARFTADFVHFDLPVSSNSNVITIDDYNDDFHDTDDNFLLTASIFQVPDA